MNHTYPRRTFRRRRVRRTHILAVLAIGLTAVAVLGHRTLVSSPSTAASAVSARLGEHLSLPSVGSRPLGEADGAIPDGTTVFDEGVPGVANLDPALKDALREAANDASADGVRFLLDSGWRSSRYQEKLLRDAVTTYGSEAEASRWVATPETSAHVSGDAIDIGPVNATTWLSAHGAEYGLCQIYLNESWHYELRPDASSVGCPAMYSDAAHDPRMRG